MFNSIFCSECGMRLLISRKAVKTAGIIVGLVDPHTCLEIPIVPDFKSITIPIFEPSKAKGKFADKLEDISPSPHFPLSNELDEAGVMDKRPEIRPALTSNAPKSVLDEISKINL
jgi:hypothetical protein